MNKKIYCGSCYFYTPRYFYDIDYFDYERCKCREAMIKKDTPIGIEYDDSPEKINVNNDCAFHSKEVITEFKYKKIFGITIYKEPITKIIKTCEL